jgi:hypothetical protein
MAWPITTASRSGRAFAGTLFRAGLAVLALSVGASPVPCAAADLLDRPSACDQLKSAGRPDETVELPSKRGPSIHGAIPDGSVRNLRLGFALALESVRSTAPCRTLFASLAASGVTSLISTHYVAPANRDAARICAGGVAAFTTVGGRVTWLCPQFSNLHPRAAAFTLIHEALHSAGMPESPATAGALTALEINDLVESACAPGPASRDVGTMVARNP